MLIVSSKRPWHHHIMCHDNHERYAMKELWSCHDNYEAHHVHAMIEHVSLVQLRKFRHFERWIRNFAFSARFTDEHFWTSLIQCWKTLATSQHINNVKSHKRCFIWLLIFKRQEFEIFRINSVFWIIVKTRFFLEICKSLQIHVKSPATTTKIGVCHKI